MEEGDNVLCTVDKIDGTTVFVKLEDSSLGTIVVSEIAPGRIRNLRDYVVPGKKIVCKILKIEENNIHLSLRRVSDKEKREVLDKVEKEKNSLSILKSVLKERAEDVSNKIKTDEKSVFDFLQNCKLAPEKLNKYLDKTEANQICKILAEKKEKQVEIKKGFLLKSSSPDGILVIKKLLLPYKDKIIYLSAGRYSIKIKAENYKKANSDANKILQEIQSQAKKEKAEFEEK